MQNAFEKTDLLRCASGEMFGPDNAKLPSDRMLMIDRITKISNEGGHYGNGEMIAELDIHPDLWFFGCHFQDDPVMPGCLGLDAMWQLVGFFLGWKGFPGRGRALGSDKVKFSGQVLPSNRKIVYHINIRRVTTRKLTLGIGDGVLSVDGRDIYFASNLRVGLFQDVGTI